MSILLFAPSARHREAVGHPSRHLETSARAARTASPTAAAAAATTVVVAVVILLAVVARATTLAVR
jgi:hypothetical protein